MAAARGCVGVGPGGSFLFHDAPGARALAEAAGYAALWIAFTRFGARLTYLATTIDHPLQDALLARLDGALGFDWIAWAGFVREHTALRTVLALSYQSFLPQLAASVLWFAFARVPGHNEELLLLAMLAALATTAIAAILPAFGPWWYFWADPFNPASLDLAMLRAPVAKAFSTITA